MYRWHGYRRQLVLPNTCGARDIRHHTGTGAGWRKARQGKCLSKENWRLAGPKLPGRRPTGLINAPAVGSYNDLMGYPGKQHSRDQAQQAGTQCHCQVNGRDVLNARHVFGHKDAMEKTSHTPNKRTPSMHIR
jgi:hypothetical protein